MIIPNLWKHKNVPNHQPVMFNLEWKIQVYSVHFVRRRKKKHVQIVGFGAPLYRIPTTER